MSLALFMFYVYMYIMFSITIIFINFLFGARKNILFVYFMGIIYTIIFVKTIKQFVICNLKIC
jgi:hypothetical protein